MQGSARSVADRPDQHARRRRRLGAIVRWTHAAGQQNVRSVNALVGETNDGGLNDIRGLHHARHVASALSGADRRRCRRAVGAGTGTVAFGWKGGIGTSSRRVRQQSDSGRSASRAIELRRPPHHCRRAGVEETHATAAKAPARRRGRDASRDGSCVVVATDAPLDHAHSSAWPPAPSSRSHAPDRPTRTAAATSRSHSHASVARVTDGSPAARTILPSDSVSGLFGGGARCHRRSGL